MQRPAPIIVNQNEFAHYTMRQRQPDNLREVQKLNPALGSKSMDALDTLCADLAQGNSITLFDPHTAPDYTGWLYMFESEQEYIGKPLTWHNCRWFFAETYLFRTLVGIVRWFENGHDPFLPKKLAELKEDRLWTLLDYTQENSTKDIASRLHAAFDSALWGNRIDLSYEAVTAHAAATDEDLLVDGREVAISHLLASAGGTIHIIADNAGTELAMDLALVDVLLSDPAVAGDVVLHLKVHPTFVSDALTTDVWTLVDAMQTHSDGLAHRLLRYFETGRLKLLPHPFWTSSLFTTHLPPHLTDMFRKAKLVVFKGDANHRRLLDDGIWETTTPFSQVVESFPAPLLTLRTLKSDPVVGLPQGLAAQLDRQDPTWRINGKRGVIQYAGK